MVGGLFVFPGLLKWRISVRQVHKFVAPRGLGVGSGKHSAYDVTVFASCNIDGVFVALRLELINFIGIVSLRLLPPWASSVLYGWVGVVLSAWAYASPPAEYQLKAAYMLNFARFIDWPVQRLPPGAPLRVCVLGQDPFHGALVALEGRVVQGHEVQVRQLDGLEPASDCHMLFVAESEQRRVAAVLHQVANKGVLTISDMDGFVPQGGSIGFVLEDNRVRFNIHQGVLLRDNLRASAQLLKLGRQVVGGRSPEP